MKTSRVIGMALLGLTTATVVSVICKVRQRNALNRLSLAADKGYEIAYDEISNEKFSPSRNKNLKYGPVLPKV
ncbi:MAG: hypothetical protein QM727_04790 [Niabella sp.]